MEYIPSEAGLDTIIATIGMRGGSKRIWDIVCADIIQEWESIQQKSKEVSSEIKSS